MIFGDKRFEIPFTPQFCLRTKFSIMKKKFLCLFLSCFAAAWTYGQITYNLSYDQNTEVYTVSMRSGKTYTGGQARLSSTSQVMIVAPHTTGGFQITNVTGLQTGGTALNWGYSRVDAPSQNPTKDYFFFSPSNAFVYTPFDVPANTQIDLFSFQSGSGCLGNLQIMDNNTDPFVGNGSFNANNNLVVVGGGMTNLYQGNTSSAVSCVSADIKYCIDYDEPSKSFILSIESAADFVGNLSRISPSTQVTLVFPHETGGFQIDNLTNLQGGNNPLNWAINRLDAPTENPGSDYLFFAPTNAFAYTPFDISANTKTPLFSFQLVSDCTGFIALYDNDNDPIKNIVQYSPENNMVIVGSGTTNQYTGNSCPTATCANCPAKAGVLSY